MSEHEIPRCNTCKHWGGPHDDPKHSWRGCYAVRTFYDRGAPGDGGVPLGPRRLCAYTEDAVETLADFGCVEHEAK
jgi:hypothetical protein